jgi:hypothetical protein
MLGATRGEPIARTESGPNVQDSAGARTLRGSPRASRSLLRVRAGPGEDRSKLCGTGACGFGRRAEVRERRLGEIPAQGSRWRTLEGLSPREQPAARVLTTRQSPGTSGRVKAQKPRPSVPASRLDVGYNGGKNGTWVHPVRKRSGYRREGGSSVGRNPMSAAGAKQNRPGNGGRKPSRG